MESGTGKMLATQDQKERREIRHQFRNLLAVVQKTNDEEEISTSATDTLSDVLHQTNAIYEKVKMPREAAMDASVLALVAQAAKSKSRNLHTDFMVFEPVDFTKKVRNFLHWGSSDDSPIVTEKQWASFGSAMQPFYKKAPPLHYMFGSFERGQPKPPKKREPKPKDKENAQAKATNPEQLTSLGDGGRHETTTEEVEKQLEILETYYAEWNQQPICYFEFVVNPHSFTQTIENIFYSSFLVRDGHVKISLDDDKLPVIEPIGKSEGEQQTAKSMERLQTAMVLTEPEWKEIIRVFKLKDPIIPTRQSRQTDQVLRNASNVLEAGPSDQEERPSGKKKRTSRVE